MNKRRALLASSKKTAPIYKKGAADWQNVENVIQYQYALASMDFTPNYLDISTEDSATTGARIGLQINEAIYKEYKTLVFTAKRAGATLNPELIKIGWSENSQDINQAIVSYQLSANEEKYKIDVSNDTGTRYILINIYYRGHHVYIYDMHFE